MTGHGATNPDRRFQIFVSSTFEDLHQERKKTIEVIFERGHIPIVMEGFSAANASDLEIIKNAIADCQIYVAILGHRYGSIVPGTDISYTELEYDLALENGLLVLPFVLKKDEVLDRRKRLLSPDDPEQANYDRLLRFQERLRKHSRKFWGSSDEFRYLVANALHDDLPHCLKPGFVREAQWPAMELLRSAAQNEFIVDIVNQLKSFDKLYKRCLEHPEEKREVARFFRQQYMDRILRHRVTLFLESGSTVAYVAKEISHSLSGRVGVDERGSPSLQISTNNLLAYLLLWLKARVPCTLFPWSPPQDETYGATYGPLQEIEQIDPDYGLHPLDQIAEAEIAKLKELPFSPLKLKRPALLLCAASGLQLGADHKLTFTTAVPELVMRETQTQVDRCFGPHVGSYHNKVFKRFLYATGLPIVIFITGGKIDSMIEANKCHFIFDDGYKWADFCNKHPVAFCVGYAQGTKKQCAMPFQDLGFDIVEGSSSGTVSAFIAKNKEFVRQFEELTPIGIGKAAM